MAHRHPMLAAPSMALWLLVLPACSKKGSASPPPSSTSTTLAASTANQAPCDDRAVIAATTPHAGLARVGGVYSSTLYDGKLKGENDTEKPQQIAVTVTAGGAPLKGCAVSWTPSNGTASGWVYPDAEVTDENGVVNAWWIAGTAAAQSVTATVLHHKGSKSSAQITGQATPQHTPASALHVVATTGKWDRFAIDVTPMSLGPTTYFEAVGWDGAYTGIQSKDGAAEGELLFSVWDWKGKAPQVIAQGPGMDCRRFGGEGTGVHCSRPYTPLVKTTYRFEVDIDEVKGNADVSDFSAYFTDNSDGKRVLLGTVRFGGPFVAPSGAGGFIEDWSSGRPELAPAESCLATAVRAAKFGHAQYRDHASGNWVDVTKFTADASYNPRNNHICRNYHFELVDGEVLATTGGLTAGPPLGLPGAPRNVHFELH